MSTDARGTQEPSAWARQVVTIATRVLPAGSIRERYRQELIAEMYGMTSRQLRTHTRGVVLHIWSLRAAIAGETRGFERVVRTRRALGCRTNLHHHWHLAVTEDGSRYQRCTRCGADNDGTYRPGPADAGGGYIQYMGNKF